MTNFNAWYNNDDEDCSRFVYTPLNCLVTRLEYMYIH